MHIAIKSVALQLCQISSKSEMVVRTFVRILDQLRWNDLQLQVPLYFMSSSLFYSFILTFRFAFLCLLQFLSLQFLFLFDSFFDALGNRLGKRFRQVSIRDLTCPVVVKSPASCVTTCRSLGLRASAARTVPAPKRSTSSSNACLMVSLASSDHLRWGCDRVLGATYLNMKKTRGSL